MKSIYAVSGVLTLLFLAYLPIYVPYSYTTTGMLYPSSEWTLTSNNDGGFDSKVMYYSTGKTGNIANYRFERGDLSGIQLRPGLDTGGIRQGDTIGAFVSVITMQQLEQIELEIAVEAARLSDLMTGEKVQIRDAAREEIAIAEQEASLRKKDFERALQLLPDRFISMEEYDRIANELQLAQLRVSLAKQRLEVVATGEKPELIALSQARIEALRRRKSLLTEQAQRLVLTAPVSGTTIEPVVPEIVLHVLDTTTLLVRLPVKQSDRDVIDRGSLLEITFPPSHTSYQATITRLEQKVSIVNGQPVIFAYAALAERTPLSLPGTMVRCKVYSADLQLLSYLKKVAGFGL